MKILVLTIFLLVFLTSCGPHRMGCGARGICESPSNGVLVKDNS